MDFEMLKSKVYIRTDEKNRITRCEGGCTTPSDLTGWIFIDEGNGDRYGLCQGHYFDGGLYTSDGIPRYKLVDGKPVLRDEDEIAADRAAREAKTPAEQREAAYNSDAVIEWGGETLTVTQAAQQWAYYAAEGNADKTAALSALIAAAKAEIREKHPDEEVQGDA